MDVCLLCSVLSGRGLCDELITRPEESYRLCCVIVCDIETSRMRRRWVAAPQTKKITFLCTHRQFSKINFPSLLNMISSCRNLLRVLAAIALTYFKQSCTLEHTGRRKSLDNITWLLCHPVKYLSKCIVNKKYVKLLKNSHSRFQVVSAKRNNIAPQISVDTWSLFAQLFVQGGVRLRWWTCCWPSC